ncbi:hypothetical protein AMTR_s00039p00169050 [Amborella trichopoda]|uniref:Cytochrome P450 n=1 Tax=Amborella trichopoda TaxID=13333 RepID=U5D0R4_AMBTC|nr:hypothetical protein AMTR_s00039p00169050 [Amborella trichopoda]
MWFFLPTASTGDRFGRFAYSSCTVQSFQSVREEEVAAMVSAISGSSNGDPVDLSKIFYTLANRIICRVALGYSEGDQTEHRFYKIIQELNSLVGSFCAADLFASMGWIDILTGFHARLKKNFRELDCFLDKVIRDHKSKEVSEATTTNEDFVDILLQAQKDYILDIPLTLDNLKAIILVLFHTKICFPLCKSLCLITNSGSPIVQDMFSAGTETKLNAYEDEVPELEYFHSVIKEVPRLHPPVPLLVPRESKEGIKIDGYDIPAKTRVYINAWAIGRHPDCWDQAGEFLPEMFMSSTIDFRGQDFEFIPFGAGRRSCPGYLFAIHTVVLAAANLIQHFEWEVPLGGLDMAESSGITAHRKYPLYVLATPRCI